MKTYIAILASLIGVFSQLSAKDSKLHSSVEEAIALLKKQDSSLAVHFESAHGYAIFPKVGKGGIGIGGARGTGLVFEKGKPIGEAKLTQVTIGFQLGGQVYIEAIFFEDEEALSRFKSSRYELSAQASAVAAAEGASKNAKYQHGVMIYTLAKNGLMYEASVGGQKFKFSPNK